MELNMLNEQPTGRDPKEPRLSAEPKGRLPARGESGAAGAVWGRFTQTWHAEAIKSGMRMRPAVLHSVARQQLVLAGEQGNVMRAVRAEDWTTVLSESAWIRSGQLLA